MGNELKIDASSTPSDNGGTSLNSPSKGIKNLLDPVKTG